MKNTRRHTNTFLKAREKQYYNNCGKPKNIVRLAWRIERKKRKLIQVVEITLVLKKKKTKKQTITVLKWSSEFFHSFTSFFQC